jgi:predicted HAD superfamily Cof-like phosphohydrolase
MSDKLKKSEHYQRVLQFMRNAGQTAPETLTEQSATDRLLRARLSLEEVMEKIVKGLGVAVAVQDKNGGLIHLGGIKEFRLSPGNIPFNLAEVVDGCLDMIVIATGTLVSLGVPDVYLQEPIDEDNLKKFGPEGGHLDAATGKWIKSGNHKGPELAKVLAEMFPRADSETGSEENSESESAPLDEEEESA